MGRGIDRRSHLLWEAWETEDLRRNYGREPVPRLAERYGRSCGAVMAKANVMGIRSRCRRSFTDAEKAVIRAEYADTPTEKTALKLGAAACQVMQAANGMGLRKSAAYMREMIGRRRVKNAATWARKREMKMIGHLRAEGRATAPETRLTGLPQL